MKKIQIQDGKVHWIFTLDQLPEWNPQQITVVDYPSNGYQPVEGDLYENGVFSPAPRPTPEPKTVFSTREYLNRFTRAEYAAARTHANIDVQWALDNMISAQFIDIEDPDTIGGLDLMVAEGVITAQRRDELLTPQPTS